MSKENRNSTSETIAQHVNAVIEQAKEATTKQVDALLEDGAKIRGQALDWAEDAVERVQQRAARMQKPLEEVRDKATDALSQLEQVFEERVARALQQLNIPTAEDLQRISERLESISQRIQALTAERVPMPKTVPLAESGAQDDLRLIKGVGPALAHKLKAAGICSYRQVALLGEAEIANLDADLVRRMHRDDWMTQARQLHAAKYAENL